MAPGGFAYPSWPSTMTVTYTITAGTATNDGNDWNHRPRYYQDYYRSDLPAIQDEDEIKKELERMKRLRFRVPLPKWWEDHVPMLRDSWQPPRQNLTRQIPHNRVARKEPMNSIIRAHKNEIKQAQRSSRVLRSY